MNNTTITKLNNFVSNDFGVGEIPLDKTTELIIVQTMKETSQLISNLFVTAIIIGFIFGLIVMYLFLKYYKGDK